MSLRNQSKLEKKYATTIDRESACEILTSKLEEAAQKSEQQKEEKQPKSSSKQEKSTLEKVLESPVTQTNRPNRCQCNYP